MKSRITIFILALLLVTAVPLFAQQQQLVKIWETDSTLKVPESVLYDPAEKVLYVSCINGKSNEKDLNGYIAKVSLTGKIIEPEWAKNLSAPKGMGIRNNMLYVADLDEVVVINMKDGKIAKRIPVAGAIFLNDVTVDQAGIVYVSDSQTGKAHQLNNDVVTLWLDKKPGVNGLLAVKGEMYLAVKDTLYKANASKTLTIISTGMDESSDGIVQSGTELIVSCWNGIIYSIKSDGTKRVLLDTRAQKSNTADIGFDPTTKTLYVPTFFKNKVVAYRVN